MHVFLEMRPFFFFTPSLSLLPFILVSHVKGAYNKGELLVLWVCICVFEYSNESYVSSYLTSKFELH